MLNKTDISMFVPQELRLRGPRARPCGNVAHRDCLHGVLLLLSANHTLRYT